MKNKIVKKFEYDGLGFPVILLNVPVCDVRGVIVPKINYNHLQESAMMALCNKPAPLTGNEIRFIRQFSQLNYTEFARKFGVTHSSVIHWEKLQNEFAKIIPTTELFIRLHILEVLKVKDHLFRETFRKFDCENLKSKDFSSSKDYLTLDSSNLLEV